jgi:hypothetical protein
MNRRTDNEHLLDDVLAPESGSEFGANVLAETLRGVRRQRRGHQVRRVGGALVVLVVALTSSHFLRRGVKPELAHAPPPLNYQLVVNQPLTADQTVSTHPLTPEQSVTSTITARLVLTVAGGFGEIGDDELLSLAAPQVVALVRRGPHEAELVFVSSSVENSDSHQN